MGPWQHLLIFLPLPGKVSGSAEYETSGSSGTASTSATGLTGIMVAKSMEFSYQELAKATNNFSLENKIGQGEFGIVYYAELRGEVGSYKYIQFYNIIRQKNINGKKENKNGG